MGAEHLCKLLGASRDMFPWNFLAGFTYAMTLSVIPIFSVSFVSVTYIRPPGFAWSKHGNLVVMNLRSVSAER